MIGISAEGNSPRTLKPVVGGVLTLANGVLALMFASFLAIMFVLDPYRIAEFVIVLLVFYCSALTLLGGAAAISRRNLPLALSGAVAATVLFFISFGFPPHYTIFFLLGLESLAGLVLIAASYREFRARIHPGSNRDQ